MRATVYKSVNEIDPYGVIAKEPFSPHKHMNGTASRNLSQAQTQYGGQSVALPTRLSLFQHKQQQLDSIMNKLSEQRDSLDFNKSTRDLSRFKKRQNRKLNKVQDL